MITKKIGLDEADDNLVMLQKDRDEVKITIAQQLNSTDVKKPHR